MARRKNKVAPMPRINSGEVMKSVPEPPSSSPAPKPLNGMLSPYNNITVLPKNHKRAPSYERTRPIRDAPLPPALAAQSHGGSVLSLIVCVSGIYASFLTWGLLQERINTTPFDSEPASWRNSNPPQEFFKYPVFINTIQSFFAFLSGSLYLLFTTKTYNPLPSQRALKPLALISITTTLASPFGYASLAHVDYLTFVLAKSCKLLPVMFLHITLFRKRYPLSKYLIVLAVTAGVAIFTLYHPPKKQTTKSKTPTSTSSTYGLALLGINLLFDGLTNVTQDHLFSSPPSKYSNGRKLTGPQMMVCTNFLALLLQLSYLFLPPLLPASILSLSPIPLTSSASELPLALSFLSRHPSLLPSILAFCLAGAIGQLFIFATLERFSSLVLVTVTVTRKMLTMVLSVVWYGKRLTPMQWAGVALVFAGVAAEGWLSQRAKMERERGRQKEKEAKAL